MVCISSFATSSSSNDCKILLNFALTWTSDLKMFFKLITVYATTIVITASESASKPCKLPLLSANHVYTIDKCRNANPTEKAICRTKPGDYVEHLSSLRFKCARNFFTKGDGGEFFSFCVDGSWRPSIDQCRPKSKTPEITVRPNASSCLGCLCDVENECTKTNSVCNRGSCNWFEISYDYWVEGGKRTKNNENTNTKTAFHSCVTDLQCARNTVVGYLQRFSQDCNEDHVIDCYDYAAIHRFGGYDCSSLKLNKLHLTRLKMCLESNRTLASLN